MLLLVPFFSVVEQGITRFPDGMFCFPILCPKYVEPVTYFCVTRPQVNGECSTLQCFLLLACLKYQPHFGGARQSLSSAPPTSWLVATYLLPAMRPQISTFLAMGL